MCVTTDHSKRSEIDIGHHVSVLLLCSFNQNQNVLTNFSTIPKIKLHENQSGWSSCAMMMGRRERRCFSQLFCESTYKNLHPWISYVICCGWLVYTKRYHIKHIHHSSSNLSERRAKFYQHSQQVFKKSLTTGGIKLPHIMVWQKQKQYKGSVSSAVVQDAAMADLKDRLKQ